MTQPLTPRQLADVAKEVTGHSELIEASETVLIQKSWRWDSNLWEPDFKGAEWQRSQAFAVVEWLNDYFNTPRKKTRKEASKMSELNYFLEAFHERDIAALQRLVLELKGAAP